MASDNRWSLPAPRRRLVTSLSPGALRRRRAMLLICVTILLVMLLSRSTSHHSGGHKQRPHHRDTAHGELQEEPAEEPASDRGSERRSADEDYRHLGGSPQEPTDSESGPPSAGSEATAMVRAAKTATDGVCLSLRAVANYRLRADDPMGDVLRAVETLFFASADVALIGVVTPSLIALVSSLTQPDLSLYYCGLVVPSHVSVLLRRHNLCVNKSTAATHVDDLNTLSYLSVDVVVAENFTAALEVLSEPMTFVRFWVVVSGMNANRDDFMQFLVAAEAANQAHDYYFETWLSFPEARTVVFRRGKADVPLSFLALSLTWRRDKVNRIEGVGSTLDVAETKAVKEVLKQGYVLRKANGRWSTWPVWW